LLNLTGSQESFSKQLPKNIISNIAYFSINIVIGLLLVPYFIDTLGVASYGLIPLATSMTNYINLVIQSFNYSISRYLTIDLQKKDYEKANITFNTALFGTLSIILLMIPIVLLISYYAPLFFSIPANQKLDTILLFFGIISAFLVRMWGSNFGVTLFAYNRLDLQNIVNLVNLIVQVGCIIIFFSELSPKLSYIGASYLIAAIVSFLTTYIFSKRTSPYLKVNPHYIRRSHLKKLSKTAGWLTTDQIGTLLLFQLDLIIVNKLFGTVAGGEYSIVLTWNILIRAISGMLAGFLTPLIFTYYAKEMYDEIIVVSKSSVKFMGLIMALPIGVICGFSPLILSFWVGSEYVKLSPLMWILLIHLAANMSLLPLFPINVAYNKVRIPAIATLILGIVNLLLAILLSSITELGYYGVAVAGAIVLTFRHFFFVPYYATKLLKVSKSTYLNSMITVLLSTVSVAGISNVVYNLIDVWSLESFLLCCGLICVIYIQMIWKICLNQSERRKIEMIIPLSFQGLCKYFVKT